MRVLLLAEYYPPDIYGGAEICAERLVKKLVEKGIYVYVLTPNCEDNKDVVEVVNPNYIIHRYKSIKRFTYKKSSKDASSEVYNKSSGLFYIILNQVIKLFNMEMYHKAKKVLRENDFDVVQSNNIDTMEVLSKLYTLAAKFSYIRDLGMLCLNYRTYHGDYTQMCGVKELKEYLGTNSLFAWLIKHDIVKRRLKEMKEIDFFVAINEYVKEQAVVEGIDQHRIFVVRDPIDAEVSSLTREEARKKYNIMDNHNVVLFVGSLTKVKGAHLVNPIAAQLPHVNFIVAGDGPLAEDFKDNMMGNVSYLGRLRSDEIKHLMRASDILLLPQSVHYGIGLVAIEAMQSGLPIISSNVSGISEYIKHDKTGYVVQHNTIAEFVSGIKYMIDNKVKRKQYSKEARLLIDEAFDFDKNVNELIMRYNGSTWRE